MGSVDGFGRLVGVREVQGSVSGRVANESMKWGAELRGVLPLSYGYAVHAHVVHVTCCS